MRLLAERTPSSTWVPASRNPQEEGRENEKERKGEWYEQNKLINFKILCAFLLHHPRETDTKSWIFRIRSLLLEGKTKLLSKLHLHGHNGKESIGKDAKHSSFQNGGGNVSRAQPSSPATLSTMAGEGLLPLLLLLLWRAGLEFREAGAPA